MSDVIAPAVQPAPEVPVAAPVAEAPLVSSAPIVESPVVEAPVVPPVVDPVEAPVVEADKPEIVAEAEKPVEAEAPKVEGEPVEPVVTAPTYAEFKLPEGLKADAEQIEGYTGILGKHGISQEAGQELLDFHQAQIQALVAASSQNQQDVFAQTRAGWVKDGQKMFGNHYDTTINDARTAITQLFTDKKERTDLWNALAFTGAGDHPLVIRAFARAARKMNERGAPLNSVPGNGSQSGPAWDKRYGKS